mgnify:CR=1 FL=1
MAGIVSALVVLILVVLFMIIVNDAIKHHALPIIMPYAQNAVDTLVAAKLL